MSDTPHIKRFKDWFAEYGGLSATADKELQDAYGIHACKAMLNDLAAHIEELYHRVDYVASHGDPDQEIDWTDKSVGVDPSPKGDSDVEPGNPETGNGDRGAFPGTEAEEGRAP